MSREARKFKNWNNFALVWYRPICVCVSVSIGRKQSGGRRCQTVGMEDQQQPGKLRKYECCPVSSKSKKKSQKLVKGVAFIGDEDDSDNNGDDYVRDDDFLDDDHNDDNNDDDDTDDKPHHNPSIPDPDQHDHTSSRSSSPQHAQSYDYISDDEFVHDAGIHKSTNASHPVSTTPIIPSSDVFSSY